MLHSKLTSKGQTTIPGPVRQALNLKPGDRITYELEEGRVTLRVQPGARALRGVLASKNGNGLSFAEIRTAAAAGAKAKIRAARNGWGR
jgi:AbrB family looped-hinge helix DNA binding protein